MPKRTVGEPPREPDGEPLANRDTNQGRAKRRLGVRKLERAGRPNPHGVQWREKIFDEHAGRLVSMPKTLFFPTKAARDEKYNEMLALRRGRMLTASVSREWIDKYRAFETAAEGVPWQVILSGYRENLVRAGRAPCLMTVQVAVTDYLAEMLKLRDHTNAAGEPEPKLGADTYRQKEHKLELFADEFGKRLLDDVKGFEVELWADDFEEVRTDITFDNYVKHVSALYGHCIARKIIRDNPCATVERRSDGPGEVKILSPEQCAHLFHTALTYTEDGEKPFLVALGRLALEFFLGLRFASAGRVSKKEINFADRGVLLPRRKLKTGKQRGGRKHYVDGMPDQLWAWLAVTPEECWTLAPRDYLTLKSKLFVVAGVPHPHNCARHSFATYDLRAHKNPGRTATLLCHTDQEQLWEHYLGIATHEMGKKYQRITPGNCAELAQGWQPVVFAAFATPEDAPLQLPA